MWIGRSVLEALESIIFPITHRATVEIHLFIPRAYTKLVILLTPLKQ